MFENLRISHPIANRLLDVVKLAAEDSISPRSGERHDARSWFRAMGTSPPTAPETEEPGHLTLTGIQFAWAVNALRALGVRLPTPGEILERLELTWAQVDARYRRGIRTGEAA